MKLGLTSTSRVGDESLELRSDIIADRKLVGDIRKRLRQVAGGLYAALEARIEGAVEQLVQAGQLDAGDFGAQGFPLLGTLMRHPTLLILQHPRLVLG